MVVVSIASAASDSMNAAAISVARVSRVVIKLYKLIKTVTMLSGMRKILEATAASMASMVNVGGLLVLIMSVYCVIGMKFFWNVKDDGVFTTHANFRDFPTALLSMFRVATVHPPLIANCPSSSEAPVSCGGVFACRKTIGTICCTAPWMVNAISPTLEVAEGTLRSPSSTAS